MFSVGQLVDVKGHGRAEVMDLGTDLTPCSMFFNRVQVKYIEDGTTFWTNKSKIRHMKPTTKRVVVAYRTEEYRQAVVHNLDKTHACVEIGCHEGVTTRIASNRCASIVGVDIGSKVVEVARTRSPHLRFEVRDGMDLQAILALSPTGSYDRVLIDISGQAGLHLVAPMVAAYVHALPDAVVIVKNRVMHGWVERWERQQQGPQQDQQQQGQQQQRQEQEQAQEQERGGQSRVQRRRQRRQQEAAANGVEMGGGRCAAHLETAEAAAATADAAEAAAAAAGSRHASSSGGDSPAEPGAADSDSGGSSLDGKDSNPRPAPHGQDSDPGPGADQHIACSGAAAGAEAMSGIIGFCETFQHRSPSFYKTSPKEVQREAERRARSKAFKQERKKERRLLRERRHNEQGEQGGQATTVPTTP